MTCDRIWSMRMCVRAAAFVAVAVALCCAKLASGAEPLRSPIRDEKHKFRRYVKSWTDLRTENVVVQQRDYSCGAAALSTLINYHLGGAITETQVLRQTVQMLTQEEILDRVRNGLSLTDLRRVSVRLGYLSTIGRLKFEKLCESKVPVVVGIEVNDFEHFVVYRGTDDRYVCLADLNRQYLRKQTTTMRHVLTGPR